MHDNRIVERIYKILNIFKARYLMPRRLVDSELIEHGGELVAIFRAVD